MVPEPWLPPVTTVGHKYAKAPIVEAAIDLDVSKDPSLNVEDLAKILDPAGFPERRKVYEVSTSDWNEAGERIASRSVSGYQALSAEGDYGVVVKADGYAFSQLSAYKDWEGFVAAAERYWGAYRAVANPSQVTGATVRFVNLIVPTVAQFEVKDYLRTAFDVSPYLPQVVESFFSQIEIPLEGVYEAFAPTCVLTVASQDRGVILDISVRVNLELDTQVAGFADSLTEVLGKLRHAKNYVFESCITDATRNLIS